MTKKAKHKLPAAKPAERHGPRQPIARQAYGMDRLRQALGLSLNVPIDKLCEEAAVRIEQMPPEQPAEPDETARDSML